MIGERTVAERAALVLASPAPGGLEATFVPDAGMVGCSLRHRGAELLGVRRALGAYVAERATMGIPPLYPWANRLGPDAVPARRPRGGLDSASLPLRVDGNGLPMHGLLTGARGWRVERDEATADGAVLATKLRLRRRADRRIPVPAPLIARGRGARCRRSRSPRPSGPRETPLCRSRSGFIPTCACPASTAATGTIDVPVRERLCLDERMLPTGDASPSRFLRARSGTRVVRRCVRRARGPLRTGRGGRQIELAFLGGFPYAQAFAPAEDDVVAFEPMTAPTNALVDAGPELRVLAPGDNYQAAFSITVTYTAG